MDWWAKEPEEWGVRRIRWIFLRLLAVINVIAFASLGVQAQGLWGKDGILPLDALIAHLHQAPPEAFAAEGVSGMTGIEWMLPSLGWHMPSDAFLSVMPWVGVALGVLLFLDIAPPLMLGLLWALYLSFVNVGQDFLGFQWDALLLETNFLAIWLAPWQLRPHWPSNQLGPPRAAWWLLRLLTARLMMRSGWVKLSSGDPTWRNLTALRYHYWSQPIPNPLAWYADRLPHAFSSASVLLMLFIELLVPLLLFTRLARFAFPPLLGLQALIALTGNYGFFNLLTAALCLCALDDRIFPRAPQLSESQRPRFAGPILAGAIMVLVCTVADPLPGWHLSSSYGLFAVMTTDRTEIQIEGSPDGEHWEPFVFRYKPGPPDRRPPFLGVYMPRLDWQMWFASLGTAQDNPWFFALCNRLAQGSPAVRALLLSGPNRPVYIRAKLLRYRFGEREWWSIQPDGDYLPSVKANP